MNQNDEMNAYLSMLLMKDEDLKNVFREAGKFPEEDLDEIVALFRKIANKEEMLKLAEDLVGNCVGACDPVFMLMQPPFLGDLHYLIKNNIKGADIYCLWNDCARRDGRKFLLQLWALESGVYTEHEIDENFKINHLHDYPTGQNDVSLDDYLKDDKWLIKNNRLCVFPFIFDESIINPNDYIKDPKKLTSPYDEEFKRFVMANRTVQRFKRFIIQSRMHADNIKAVVAKSPTEIEVTMVLPIERTLGDYEYRERNFNGFVYHQPKNAETVKFVVNTNQILELLDENPKKFFNQIKVYNSLKLIDDYARAIYFLRYARKQFLPSLAVIRSFPVQRVQNFYINDNDKRFCEIMKVSGLTEFEHQEGLVRLAFILGLFSVSKNESEKAYDFLKSNIVGKVSGETLHKLYGAIKVSEEEKREFAKFFMLNYAEDPRSFEDELGVDFTAKIYENFEKILEFRPEKEIDTTTDRKRLTPQMAISTFSDAGFKYGLTAEQSQKIQSIEGFSEIVKYGSSKEEILYAIDILDKAKNIQNQDIKFVYIDDDSNSKTKFRVLKKGDPEVFYTGKKSNCCFHYNGLSEESWKDAILSPNSSVVVFESEKSYAQGWFYYDENCQTLFVDNLEGRISDDEEFREALLRFADKMFTGMNKKGIICKEIRFGKDAPSLAVDAYEKLLEDKQIIDLEVPNLDYIRAKHLYTDAKCGQYIVSNKELIKNRNALVNEQNNQPS